MEDFGETNDASLNDFINTTLGGIALGEMFHRTAWLIRDPQKTGKDRMWGEIFATAIDPMGGFNRFTTGDASRVMPRPAEMVPSKLGMFGTVGAVWHGDEQGGFSSSEVDPFMEVDLHYGDFKVGQKIPYDAFVVRLGFGGGGGLSETRVRGRVLGKGVKNGSVQLAVAQGFCTTATTHISSAPSRSISSWVSPAACLPPCRCRALPAVESRCWVP